MVYKTQISGKNKTINMLINKNIGQVIESMLDYGTFCKKGGICMVSKRMQFALLISIFTLFGCASGNSATQTVNKTELLFTGDKKAIEHESMLSVMQLYHSVDENDIKEIAFLENMKPQNNESFVTNVRNADGELRSVSALKTLSEDVVSTVEKQKEAERKKREIEKKTKLARQAGIPSDENGLFPLYTTTYGVDCYGCNFNNGQGNTAMGVKLDINKGVLLPNGSWQPGIQYGKYYVIAADPGIPMCSVLKVYDHGLRGSGISPDKPFEAIVLDRGGAIRGTHVDLYIGSENSGAIQKVSNTSAKAQIIRLGGMKNGSCPL